jgi:hypothetical protein
LIDGLALGEVGECHPHGVNSIAHWQETADVGFSEGMHSVPALLK